MKVGDLFSEWKAEDGIFVKVSDVKPKLLTLSAVTAVLLMAATHVKAEQYSHQRQSLSNPTLEALLSAVRQQKLSYSAQLSDKGRTEVVAQMNQKGVADGCDININLNNPDISSLRLNPIEALDFAYFHEQAHCADYANLFNELSVYKHNENVTKMLGSDTYATHAESILNEGFADAFALFKLTLKNPEKANFYFNEIYALREREQQAHASGNLSNSHDTRKAILQAAAAWNAMDKQKLATLSKTPSGNLLLEQEFAEIASLAASEGLSIWMRDMQLDTSTTMDLQRPIEQIVNELSSIAKADVINDWRERRNAKIQRNFN